MNLNNTYFLLGRIEIMTIFLSFLLIGCQKNYSSNKECLKKGEEGAEKVLHCMIETFDEHMSISRLVHMALAKNTVDG